MIPWVTDDRKMSRDAEYDVAVIGAGISGIVTAKCLLDDKFKVVVYEKTGHIGGLWQFTQDGYGVMSFTHMYVQSRIAPTLPFKIISSFLSVNLISSLLI